MSEPGYRVAPNGEVLFSSDFYGREDIPLSDAEMDLYRLKVDKWRREQTEPSDWPAYRAHMAVLDRQIAEVEAVVARERAEADA